MRRGGEGRCYHRPANFCRSTLGVTALDPKPPDANEPADEPTPPEPAPADEPTPDPAAPAPDPAAPEPTSPPPGATPPPSGGTPPPPGPKPPHKAKAKKPKPPSLREQLGKTAQAAATLAMAHVDLAKEEASEIGREGGRLAGLVAAAVGLVIVAVILAIIGTSLFIGEWLLGSLGWGVLHGVLLFVTAAVALVLLGLRVDPVRIVRALVIGIIVGLLSGAILGLALLNQLYARIGESLGLAIDPAYRPLVVGIGIGAIIGLAIGIVAGIRAKQPNWFVAIAGGIVVGATLGAFTSISFNPQVGAGIGITLGYLTWAGLMALDVYRTGIDVENLKARFTPDVTIATSKETLEWLKERTPRGNGS